MARTTFVLSFLLALLIASPLAAQSNDENCAFCGGLVSREPAAVPRLAFVQEAELATWVPAEPKTLTVIIEASVDPSADQLLQVESKMQQFVEWARVHGPFDGFGVHLLNAEPTIAAYGAKRLAVSAQGLGVAKQIVLAQTPFDASALGTLFENGAGPYFEALVVRAADTAAAAAAITPLDPSKQIHAIVDVQSANPAFDLARAWASGALRAYATGTDIDRLGPALAQINRTFRGDWAHDATMKLDALDAKGAPVSMPFVGFVRGEDLRTLVIPQGSQAAFILSVPADRYSKPRRVDASGEKEITDAARRGARLLVGNAAAAAPFGVTLEHVEVSAQNLTKESIDVATERGITVEEIIRNHQAYDAWQESIEPRYIARNSTKLRFDIGGGAEALEAAIEGDYFAQKDGRADWVWQDFFINGVKWKYGRIPELPLIQPEKVTQLPLDLHLTNDYRYSLVRATDLLGFRVYEVRFEPGPNAPETLPLYRGTVYIDARTWARIRIEMTQLNLKGEVLSNEERIDFVAFSSDSKAPLTANEIASTDPRAMIWLPREVAAQQVISAAGRASVVQRSTTFENFRLDPAEFESLLASASASDARMVRESEAGLRYLEKRDGQRVVKEGFDTAQLFAVGGIHHDDGLDLPVVPLGGVDYFNFDLFGKGIQTNVFFAGVVLAANATHPNVGGTRTNVGVDFFGMALPTENSIYRNGEERPEEAVKALPAALFLRAGRPFLQFGKIDVSVGVSYRNFQSADDTAAGYVVPTDTLTFTPGIELRWARRGYTFSASGDYNQRSKWEPWGLPGDYDPDHKSYTRFGASIGKSFFLPRFQRIGVDLNYIDGKNLDRFSKYELGFFGSQRVHGIESGSVQVERGIIGHLSYGFVFSQQFRLEAFYDHAIVDDAAAGRSGEPFQGIGIAGQTIGPFGTLLRLDIGKTIGRNAQDGFVANIVFLKLF